MEDALDVACDDAERSKKESAGTPIQPLINYRDVPSAVAVEATRDGIFIFIAALSSLDRAEDNEDISDGVGGSARVCVLNALRGDQAGEWVAPAAVVGLRLGAGDRLLVVMLAGGGLQILQCVRGPPYLRPHASVRTRGTTISVQVSEDGGTLLVITEDRAIDVFHIPMPPPHGKRICCIFGIRSVSF